MYNKIIDPQGMSLSVNRVALPEIESLEETYTNLPSGLELGFIGEVESARLKAVFCRNRSGLTIPKWRCTQGAAVGMIDLSGEIGSEESIRGETEVFINFPAAATATTHPKDIFEGGDLWIVGGTGLTKNHGFRKFPIKGNSAGFGTAGVGRIYLESPMPIELDGSTDVILVNSPFATAQISTDSPILPTLGQTLAEVKDDEYYWAVFEGDVPANVASSASTGLLLAPTSSGGYAAASGAGPEVATFKFKSTQDLITMHVSGIYQ